MLGTSGSAASTRTCSQCAVRGQVRKVFGSSVTNRSRPLSTDSARQDDGPSPAPSRKGVLTPYELMEASPPRRCILTRLKLPSDYLLKLKPRTYDEGDYLTPMNKGDGRSCYLTLHHKAVEALYNPGPHFGIFRNMHVQAPSKLDGWVRQTLAEAIITELDLLVRRLKAKTPRVRNRSSTAEPSERAVMSVLTEVEPEPMPTKDRLIVNLPRSSDHDPPEQSRAESEVDLTDIPSLLRPGLLRSVSDLLAVERTHTIRSALARGQPLSSDTLRELVGKPPERLRAGEEGLAGRRVAFTSKEDQRSALSIPAMVALLRWRLYAGAGWTSEHRV